MKNKHLITAWNHIRRSPYQAMAAVGIMVLTFLAVSVFTFLILGSSKIITYFESKPQVTAFFKDEATQDSINTLKNQLIATGKVSGVKYVSKDQALKIYKQQNQNDPLLLELVTADILPASLEISAVNISDLPDIATLLKNNPSVQEVVFQKDVVATLTSWTNAIRILGIILIVVLSGVSIFIMTTIIGIKISQKRDEIEVIRLLGGTKWYISWPFVFEGIFYGMFGAFVGWLLSSSTLLYATGYLESFLQGIPLLPVPWFFYLGLLGAEFLLAIILGSFASLLAVGRYVK